MSKQKVLKLLTVQKANPDLYNKIMKGEISLNEAYNETQRIQLGLSEFRGPNTRKGEFSADFQRIIKLHKPSEAELIDEIKKAYPFSWKEILK